MRAPKKEIIEQKKLDVKKEHLRFSTPYVAAEYRAERLKCNTLVEIGCSIGAQTIAFAKACKKVIGVDINLGLIATAKENIKRLEIKNVEFI